MEYSEIFRSRIAFQYAVLRSFLISSVLIQQKHVWVTDILAMISTSLNASSVDLFLTEPNWIGENSSRLSESICRGESSPRLCSSFSSLLSINFSRNCAHLSSKRYSLYDDAFSRAYLHFIVILRRIWEYSDLKQRLKVVRNITAKGSPTIVMISFGIPSGPGAFLFYSGIALRLSCIIVYTKFTTKTPYMTFS